MNKVVKYQCVLMQSPSSVKDFNEKVNQLITEGFQPLSGLTGPDWGYAQAMVKYDDGVERVHIEPSMVG
ncbi:MAG: hypothetical protein ACLQVY_15705 [Limisphaerales bacterium]